MKTLFLVYNCLHSSFVLHWVLLVSCSTHSQRIAIWGVVQPDVRDDVVVEIFWQPSLVSPTHMAWCRVLLPDVRSSSGCPLNSGMHYFLQALSVWPQYWVCSQGEDEWRHNISITIANLKHHDVDRLFVFINMNFNQSLDWHQTLWNLCIGVSSVSGKSYSMPFTNFWRCKLCHNTTFLKDSAWLALVWQNLKQRKHMLKINNSNGNNLPIALYIYICIYHSISSGGDHGMHCWWDLIRSKQLFSVPYFACRCLLNFLVMVIQ